MRKIYNQWFDKGIKEYTKAGKLKRPSYSLIADWVKEAWEAIDVNLVRKSFKYCGISNEMDGSEDNLIFDFTRIDNQTNPGRGIKSQEESEDRDDDDNDEGEIANESKGEDANESEDEDTSESEGEDTNESESKDANESESEDANESESEDANESGIVYNNYYEEGEEFSVVQDLN